MPEMPMKSRVPGVLNSPSSIRPLGGSELRTPRWGVRNRLIRGAGANRRGFDFGLGADADALRETIRSFAQDRIAPRATEIGRRNTDVRFWG